LNLDDSSPLSSRRRFLRWSAIASGALGGAACESGPSDGPSSLGAPIRARGEPSPFEKSARRLSASKTPAQASSRTPLGDSYGILTPASLHFERHHSGVPNIDPAEHRLLIHGMVERPLIFTMGEIKSLPSTTRTLFLECSGNSGGEWSKAGGPNSQTSHGLASCSEWTGVPLRLLLDEAGVQADASWLLAEGADPCRMQRSLPLEKAMDDCLLAYAQNGEAIRPEQGYPLRLIAPGYEGNVCVKWLRRIKLATGPHMVRDETSKYSDLMADGKARLFTLVLDAKSVITFPSGGQSLSGAGSHEVTGLAWSGRGLIDRVEVSTDGGASWQDADLQEPRFPKAFTRFRMPWRWDGSEAVLLSRATDSSGYVQPAREELIAARGKNSIYHYNGIKPWRVAPDGSVTNVEI